MKTTQSGIVGNIIRTAIPFGYAVLNALLPKNPVKICFNSYPDMADNSYALFRFLVRERGGAHRYVWLAQDVGFAKAVLAEDTLLQDTKADIKICRKLSLAGLYHHLTSRFVFFTHGTYWFAKTGFGQTVVNLWHGMPFKLLGHLQTPRKETPFSHFTLATSDFFREIVARCFHMPESQVLVTGLPRNDVLTHPGERPDFLRAHNGRAVVTWMPTFRQSMEGYVANDAPDAPPLLTDGLLDRMDAELAKHNIVCVIKLHPMDTLNRREWKHYERLIVFTNSETKRLRINVYNLLAYSDRLVTDYSSVFLDYLLLARPIGFYVPDIDLYARGFIPEVLETIGLPGARLDTPNDLIGFVAGTHPSVLAQDNVRAAAHASLPATSCLTLARRIGL